MMMVMTVVVLVVLVDISPNVLFHRLHHSEDVLVGGDDFAHFLNDRFPNRVNMMMRLVHVRTLLVVILMVVMMAMAGDLWVV